MRLAVAVLSSILLALSVTTASPVNPSATTDVETSTSTVIPSATTSTEYSLWIVPNPNGIGLGALDALPDNVKHLLDKYVELQDARNQQSKIYWPLKSQYDSQYDVVLGVEKDLEILKYQSQKGNGNPKYGDIEKTKLDLEDQRSKLVKLRKDLDECESEIGHLAEKKWEADKQIVSLVFGTPLNPDLFNYQLLLIKETPSVKDYLVMQHLYKITPPLNPGGLSKLCAELVCNQFLACVSIQIGLVKYIRHTDMTMEAAIGRFTAWVQGYLASESSWWWRFTSLFGGESMIYENPVAELRTLSYSLFKCVKIDYTYEYGLHGGTTATITYHNMVLAQCLGTGQRDAKKAAACTAVEYVNTHKDELKDLCDCAHQQKQESTETKVYAADSIICFDSDKDKPTRSNKESARLSIEYATTTDQQDPASDWGESVDQATHAPLESIAVSPDTL